MTLFDPAIVVPVRPRDPVARVRLTVAYDGSGFKGVAAQVGPSSQPTVVGVLAAALRKVLGYDVDLVVAGRTDKGVHAWGQVMSFDAEAGADLALVQRSLNRMLGPAIAVREAAVAAPDFHARFSAVARTYRYLVVNREVPDPFLARTAWHMDEPLDLRAMQLACDPLIGEHDFSSFCRRSNDDRTPVRRVCAADWRHLGDGLLRFEITATSFCQQMVRSIVGTLVDVGRGRRRAADATAILRARDRSKASAPAPAHGLCLWQVDYVGPGERQENRSLGAKETSK